MRFVILAVAIFAISLMFCETPHQTNKMAIKFDPLDQVKGQVVVIYNTTPPSEDWVAAFNAMQAQNTTGWNLRPMEDREVHMMRLTAKCGMYYLLSQDVEQHGMLICPGMPVKVFDWPPKP